MEFTILQQIMPRKFINHLWMPLEASHRIVLRTYSGNINLKQLLMLLDFFMNEANYKLWICQKMDLHTNITYLDRITLSTLSSSSVQVVKISKKLDNFGLFRSFPGDMPYYHVQNQIKNYITEFQTSIANELHQTDLIVK